MFVLLPKSRININLLLKQSIIKSKISCCCGYLSYSSDKNDAIQRIKKEIEESKKNMNWRTPTGDRPDEWNSKFKLFADTEQNSDFISFMQQPINLSPKSIKNWWRKRNEKIERHMQSFIPERHEILGSDLATAHFVVHRGGSVRFQNNPNWIRATDKGDYNLPDRYDPNFKIEAIRCDNMLLYYEGIENIRRLQTLKFLSFRNVKTFDDWCLDRLSGSENPNLEILDLSGTQITFNGLSALYRLSNLKLLIVDDVKCSTEFELSCTMLQIASPKLRICSANDIHDDNN